MKPDIKRRLLEALRSGDYPQTTHALRKDDGFCCLGVLCELAVIDGILSPPLFEKPELSAGYRYRSAANPKDSSVSILPDAVSMWAEISARGDFYDEDGKTPTSLAERNDGGYTFPKIADLVEMYF